MLCNTICFIQYTNIQSLGSEYSENSNIEKYDVYYLFFLNIY